MNYQAALEPLDAGGGVGVDIRNSENQPNAYYKIKDLRGSIRARERQALTLDDMYALKGEWKLVLESSLKIVEEESKDIEVVAWLIEAAIRVDGFRGLANALSLMHKLLAKYWGSLHPKPDEDGLSATLFPLTGLNGSSNEGTLIMPIRMAPFVELADGTGISVYDYLKASELPKSNPDEQKKKQVSPGFRSLDDLIQAAKGQSSDYKQTGNWIQKCIESFTTLDQYLTEKCGQDAPPTSAIKNALADAWNAFSAITNTSLKDLDEVARMESETLAVEEVKEKNGEIVMRESSNSLETYYPSSREDALLMIAKVSDYFRDTEPHSPLSYQIDQVERWGRMGLRELMNELLDDEKSKEQYFRLVGLKDGAAGL